MREGQRGKGTKYKLLMPRQLNDQTNQHINKNEPDFQFSTIPADDKAGNCRKGAKSIDDGSPHGRSVISHDVADCILSKIFHLSVGISGNIVCADCNLWSEFIYESSI